MPFDALKLTYFVCSACASAGKVLVSFCMSCSNIACPHLFFGMQCMQCAANNIHIDWPSWEMRFPLEAHFEPEPHEPGPCEPWEPALGQDPADRSGTPDSEV